jgi:capsular polysaccharide transport system permease protein
MNISKLWAPRPLKIALIAVPLAAGLVYYGVVAADRYVSEATVALQQTGTEASSIPGAALMLAGVNPPAREDTLYLEQYIESLGLL